MDVTKAMLVVASDTVWEKLSLLPLSELNLLLYLVFVSLGFLKKINNLC